MTADGSMTAPLLVLVGPPGAGKSTVGRLVAERLGVEFLDTDAEIEAEAGMPISEIFVEHGEPYFRTLERAAVVRALTGHPGVLALGGGAVLDLETRRDLAGHRVAYLEVNLSSATKRVGMDASRPLLLGNVRGRLKQLMDARRPLYTEVASVLVTTDGRTPEQVADEVLEWMAK